MFTFWSFDWSEDIVRYNCPLPYDSRQDSPAYLQYIRYRRALKPVHHYFPGNVKNAFRFWAQSKYLAKKERCCITIFQLFSFCWLCKLCQDTATLLRWHLVSGLMEFRIQLRKDPSADYCLNMIITWKNQQEIIKAPLENTVGNQMIASCMPFQQTISVIFYGKWTNRYL